MAELPVSVVVQKLGSLLIDEAIFQHGVSDNVRWLERELRRMQCFLKDADSKRKEDERVRNWVRDLRDAAHRAEDIVDRYMLNIEMQPSETEMLPPEMLPPRRRRRTKWKTLIKGFLKRLARLPDVPTKLIVRHNIGIDISKLKAKIDEISNSRATYGIVDLRETGGRWDENLQARRRISPRLDDTHVIGFENDVKILLARLLDPGKARRCVISIVGMGGLGKTTLANKVYKNTEVGMCFQTRCWVSVSNDCQIIQLLKDITLKLMQVRREDLEELTEEELKEKLREFLQNRRYLVLLDDVWTRDVWDRIKAAFPDSANKSRVMITTRSSDVARSADPSGDPHYPKCLSPDESWQLFLKTVFPNQDAETCCPMELKDLGQQLAQKCGGLPLAITVLGGFLSIKRKTADVWLRVAKGMNWQSIQDGEQCLEILGLSYDDLPYYYKSCFLHLGSFPEDSRISASRLIKLWTAEGFLPHREGETTEEAAECCLEELAQRCMIQVVGTKDWSGGIKWISVHDLLRDFAIQEAREDEFLTVCNYTTGASAKMGRRLAVHCDSLNCSNPNIRTLLVFKSVSNFHFAGFKLLRVVDLEGAYISERSLLKAFTSMVHVRYLGLRGTNIGEVPLSIGKLRNLQTVDLRRTIIKFLPASFWKIQTLRHVYLNKKIPIPLMIGRLKLNHLQTLEGAQPGEWMTHHLANLTSLRELGVGYAPGTNIMEFKDEDFVAFPCGNQDLRVAELWGPIVNGRLPSSHEFPPYLTKLTLVCSLMEQDPMPTLEKLPFLKILGLWKDACAGGEMVCSAGGFRQLQQLWLVDLHKIRNWKVESGAFPGLSFLCIYNCPSIERQTTELQHATIFNDLRAMPDKIRGKIRSKREGYTPIYPTSPASPNFHK